MTLNTSRTPSAALQRLIETDRSVDWRATVPDEAGLAALDWRELKREVLVPLLRAYQCVVRILPPGEEPHALPLLESGLHSAIQIADIPGTSSLVAGPRCSPGRMPSDSPCTAPRSAVAASSSSITSTKSSATNPITAPRGSSEQP